MRSIFKAIRTTAGSIYSQMSHQTMSKMDGSSCTFVDETLQCWQEHYLSALNFPSRSLSGELESESTMTRPNTDISVDEPTLDEVISAVKKLCNGRATDPDGIPSELLKCAESWEHRTT